MWRAICTTNTVISNQKKKGVHLMVMPTVRAELMEAGQYRDHAWKCWEELGIEELYGLSYYIYNVDQKIANNVLSTLHSKLMETITGRSGLTDIQRKALDPVVRAFADGGILGRLINDIRIYIEACIGHKEQDGDTVMLVTTVYKTKRGELITNILQISNGKSFELLTATAFKRAA